MIDKCYKRYSNKISTYTLDKFSYFKEKLSKDVPDIWSIISYYINKSRYVKANRFIEKFLNIAVSVINIG